MIGVVIWSPSMIQTIMTHKAFGFAQIVLDHSDKVIEQTPAYRAKAIGPTGDMDESEMHLSMIVNIAKGLQGAELRKVNSGALRVIERAVTDLGTEKRVDSLFDWIRRVLTDATSEVLFGDENPFKHQPELHDKLWEYDDDLMGFYVPGFWSSFFARKGYHARNAIQAAMAKYFEGFDEDDPSVSKFIRQNFKIATRDNGLTPYDFSRGQFTILWVAVVNTAPTLFWLIAHVWTDAELISRVREEVLGVVQLIDGGNEAVVDVTQLEDKCPLLTSCFRETVRLSNQISGNRYAKQDVVVRDDSDGREYLIKNGTHVMWSTKNLHRSRDVWGDDAGRFRADRLLGQTLSKSQRQNFLPFGGGKHLCPGRHFAAVETQGLAIVLALGFEIEGLSKDDTIMGTPPMSSAVPNPTKSQGRDVHISRRKGWENVRWRFKAE
jgi:cytochrome P450